MLAEGSPRHNHVWCILNSVAGLGGGPVANGQANNGHETKLVAAATLNTSAIPLSTPSRGRHATASQSPSAARGCGQRAIANLSTSAARGHGWCATTLQVPNFDLGIDFHLTPPMHHKTPSYPPTSSSAPTLPIDPPCTEPMTMIPTSDLYTEHHYPPTSSSSDPLGPPIGIDTLQLDTNVPDEHLPHQPSPPRGRKEGFRANVFVTLQRFICIPRFMMHMGARCQGPWEMSLTRLK
nr:hypothetical protein CFP56_75263 [Quercus suber]